MIKKIIFSIVIVLIFGYILGTLGKFFDISQTPRSADIIVSLGGDNGSRIKKTIELYENNLSNTGKIILTGVDDFDPGMRSYELDWRATYLTKKGVNRNNIVFNSKAENTLEEIFFIKRYMIEHNMHSVMFITDPPHSKRIDFFASEIANYQDANLSFIIVRTQNEWWDRDKYYTNPEAIIFVLNESVKLTYYYFQYILGNLHAK